MISLEQVGKAVTAIAEVDGAFFDARFLVQDVLGVARAFSESDDFEAAIASTVRVLGQIVEGKIDTSALSDDYDGWESCHYQHKVGQGARADMRIMFSRKEEGIRVRGFGERRLPEDFYHRMAEVGRMDLDEGESES